MRVSVALCTYNGARFLPLQLQSLLRQTRLPDQVVICDDGSSDDTCALLGAFMEEARNFGVGVELHFNPINLGYARNFEKALRLCSGDVIFLCDQDDVWCDGRVERFLKEFLSDHTCMMLHSDARLVTADGCDMGVSLMQKLHVHAAELLLEGSPQPLDAFLLRNLVTGATCALRSDVLDQGLPIGQGWVHDEWLAIVAGIMGGIGFIDECTVDYRQHDGNQIGAGRRSMWQMWRDLGWFDSRQRSVARSRLLALVNLLQEREVKLAPRMVGFQALAWRMMFARVRLYRLSEVGWRWICWDASRLFARMVSLCLAGGGASALYAGGKGAAAGLRDRMR